jgi:hypothetical protein
MTTNLKRIFTLMRLRRIFWRLFFVAAVVAVLGAISSLRAIAPRLGASAPTAFGDDGNTIRQAVAGPTAPPCNGQLITILDEKFDDVTPPNLPPFWTRSMGSIPMVFYGKLRILDCRAHPMTWRLMRGGSMIRLLSATSTSTRQALTRQSPGTCG